MIAILINTNFGQKNPTLAILIGLLCDIMLAKIIADCLR